LVVNIPSRVAELVGRHRDVVRVDLIGSRARGQATALSDWDFQIHTTNAARLVAELPMLVAPLQPLAGQWDRLVERAVYMLVLSGAIKVDLFPGNERREVQPPWQPRGANLVAIDAHFWDWILWLGSKALAKRHDLLDEELNKLHWNLLGPLGVASPPEALGVAVTEYRNARDRLEHEWEISVPRRLGSEVLAALNRHGVVSHA
jgi:hypothetical protein